ncbi:LacI family DNA-binding transcriptional regulator [Litoreibacter janthinus]|uniref:Transcriptional regulator, LacI family n=1 Tax=Litoreibacter janthinus TaxID=670154 RepID=A0A1I6GTZ2_9RHOB|nr:LacI family DNA-binding transcriptional regulator [Litoreibacter janthinus]SFR45561.1 transcriptional regulator, LacI family [Litoreibacter janthinus]
MARRPTIKDVALAAGVSPTTVDRALNGRSIVSDETMRKIADAAHRVGYHGKGIFQGKLDNPAPELRFGFVLLKKSQQFYQDYASHIERAISERHDYRITADIRYSSSQSPAEFSELLTDLGRTCNAIACGAVNDPRLNRVVQDLKGNGVPVVSMLNDFAQGIRRHYIGLNNMKVGRIAGWMITKTVHSPGKLAIFVGGNRWHGHDLREVGYRSFVRESNRGFTVLDTLVNLETRQVTYEATLDLLHRHPDLRGIYVAGGGMEGAIAALREVHETPQVALVVNEITVESRAALLDGYVTMVISTPLRELCQDAIEMMIQSTVEEDDGVSGQKFLEPRIVLPESL